MLAKLLSSSIPPAFCPLVGLYCYFSEIGVMTPYNAQVNLLQQMLGRKYSKVEVSTVDGFQGREKEAIIVSPPPSLPPSINVDCALSRLRNRVGRAKR